MRYLATLFLWVFPIALAAQQPKELDYDVNYNEASVPNYVLPGLLETTRGEQIKTVVAWEQVRRPEILSLFANLVYGQIPVARFPITTSHDVIETTPGFMDGRATRKRIHISFENAKGRADMTVVLIVPNGLEAPAPAIMIHSFDDTQSNRFDEHPEQAGVLRNGWPVGEMLDRGYAFVAVYQQDLVGHNEVSFQEGIHPLFYRDGQSFPKANEWGVLSAVAWGGMRVMDYLEQDSDIDHTRVALMGHSKMGKAALWTGAQDERFALVVSAQSGCAGAALWRRRSGETLKKMVTRFPYWLSRNAWNFIEQEDDLPVDQHMLIALMAPRPVYIASGEADTWADPRGEYLSGYHAGPAFELYGEKGLHSATFPEVDQPIIESTIGYHVRKGGHSVERYDWTQFMNFADYHFKERKDP